MEFDSLAFDLKTLQSDEGEHLSMTAHSARSRKLVENLLATRRANRYGVLQRRCTTSYREIYSPLRKDTSVSFPFISC
jgi:hypothetical protein